MKNTGNIKGFRNLCANFSVNKHAKWFGMVPFAIIIIAVIIISAGGATSCSYTDAVGIGIDFEGGTLLTVTLGKDAIDNYDKNVKIVEDALREEGVVISYVQQQRAENIDDSAITFRYKNISNNDTEVMELNKKIENKINSIYEHIEDNARAESVSPTAAACFQKRVSRLRSRSC